MTRLLALALLAAAAAVSAAPAHAADPKAVVATPPAPQRLEVKGKIQRYDAVNRILVIVGGQSFNVPRTVRVDNIPPGLEVTITYTVERGQNTIYEIQK